MSTVVISPRTVQVAKVLLKHLDKRVAKPSLKAFFFAYLYVCLPKIFNHVILSIRQKKYHEIIPRVVKILVNALNTSKFPMFAAKLVAGINILEPLIYKVLKRSQVSSGPVELLFLSTLTSSFISSFISFPKFQNHILTYGRYYTLDLTLLVCTRALDTALSATLAKYSEGTKLGKLVDGNAILFIVSLSFIMFSWFFRPHALPPSYRKWITSAANMDQEIIDALKHLRDGTLKYGERCEHETILDTYCERYGVDKSRGSLILNQPLECTTVHAFKTESCELHALWRFVRGFSFAIKIYGPLNGLMLLFPMKNQKMSQRLLYALKSSMRSSVFLGAFISFYWYGVCLARRRVLPKLFPNEPMTKWDDTYAPTFGAIACGFSLFIESVQRRKELALFVAPRALGTVIPLEPTLRNLRIESVVFSISLAVLVACSKSDPKNVRGIFGKGLKQVFSIDSYK